MIARTYREVAQKTMESHPHPVPIGAVVTVIANGSPSNVSLANAGPESIAIAPACDECGVTADTDQLPAYRLLHVRR